MNYIFDFDGTLMDTSRVILATIKATIQEMNLPEKTDEECRSIIGIRTDEAGQYLYPDLDIDTLAELHESGHRLAIASSRRLSSLYDYLDKLGIKDWFDIVVGADSVSKGKPDPEPVLTILRKLGWNANDTLVIGDADVDIMMGNAAVCRTCAVTYGNGSLTSLKAAGPTYIITRFSDLPK